MGLGLSDPQRRGDDELAAELGLVPAWCVAWRLQKFGTPVDGVHEAWRELQEPVELPVVVSPTRTTPVLALSANMQKDTVEASRFRCWIASN